MRRFIDGSESAWADLERRSAGRCVVFQGCEMPPGVEPGRCAVAVENGARGPKLFVAGVHAPVGSGQVRRWLECGVACFSSFAELRNFVTSVVGPLYASGHRPAADLTDLAEVQVRRAASSSTVLDAADLREALGGQVCGQDRALDILAPVVCRHLARLEPRRPLTVLAVGPTGVGKTRTAEVLPEAVGLLRGEPLPLLRIDLSEYKERHRVSQLIGAPQGYVGFGGGAVLVDFLTAHAEGCVVLLDEVEKAHPDVLEFLMNTFDAGRLSRPGADEGPTVDCRKAVFFLTSNLEVGDALAAGPATADVAEHCRKRLVASGLKPELVGRVHAFLPFTPLDEEARAEVCVLAVVAAAREYGLDVQWVEPDVVARLLDHVGGTGFGARPLEYAIDEVLGDALMDARLLAGRGACALTASPKLEVRPA